MLKIVRKDHILYENPQNYFFSGIIMYGEPALQFIQYIYNLAQLCIVG